MRICPDCGKPMLEVNGKKKVNSLSANIANAATAKTALDNQMHAARTARRT
ncbi:hypothetical protein JTF06_10525 [Desemzia sp. RIT804]|uniref:hypothetical protein n=1 Tax=Desemzia sp. RIT 804 TaxID=2810209 RepID=UPI0019509400|nr:hypothetical protein [Desemzia sp. RIT 804]MBM6615322.1 hypothetical protein [Desemzia sp. RIT 804]